MFSFAHHLEAETENIQDKLGVTYILDKMDFITYFTRPLKDRLRDNKIDLDFFGGVIQGFDNNIFLDPSRTKDAFLQTSVAGDLVYNYTRDIRFNINADITNVLFYRFNDNNLLDLEMNPGIEIDFLDDYLTLESDYALNWSFFPFDEDGSFISNQFSFFLKNNVCGEFYHKGGFRLEYRNYTNRKTGGSNGVDTDELRRDISHSCEYEASIKILDFIRLKENISFTRNDSNDQYFDYYDYLASRAKTSLTVMLTEKLYSITSIAYTRKMYDDRLSTVHQTHQKDNLYIFNSSILYELTPTFTLAGGYSYRENTSNEPNDKYSGGIWTIGLYYTF